MSPDLTLLTSLAITIGIGHTLAGPDHYLPFIMISKARGWSLSKTMGITLLCGLGHVLSSVLLGLTGVLMGTALTRLTHIEGVRGNIAAYALIAFGLVYFVWGLRKAIKNSSHSHMDVKGTRKKNGWVVWSLMVVFVLGPCEALIPLLMYPAAQQSWTGAIQVSVLFSLATIFTMISVVAASWFGLGQLKSDWLHRYMHAIAGFTILSSGLAIQFLGL